MILIDYIVGIMFIVCFICFLNNIGSYILKEKSFFLYNVLIGYIVYCFFQFVGGFISSFLPHSWMVYKIYMVFIISLLFFYTCKKKHIKQIKEDLLKNIKKYFPIYFIAFVLLSMNLFNINYLWVGNHIDDGYYLMKVANAPFYNNFNIDYTSGLSSVVSLTRIVNTFEIDYAFWSNILHIYPSVFCKAIMTYFNYFMYIISFLSLYFILSKKETKKITWKDNCVLFPILIFGLTIDMLVNGNIIQQQDSWHFSNAAWYGSTFVRCMSLPLIVLSQLLFKDIKNKIVLYIMVCVTLFSKATQALPAIIIISISLFIIYYLPSIIKKINLSKKKYYIIMFILMLIVLILFIRFKLYPISNEEIKSYIFSQITVYFESPLILISLLFVILTLFISHNNYLKQYLYLVLMIHVFVFIPVLNYLFVRFSFYTFVTGRTITMLSYSLVLSGFICLWYLLEEINISLNKIVILYISFGLACCSIFSYQWRKYSGIKKSLNTLINNYYLIPDSTKKLSDYLNNLESKDNKPLSVIAPLWVWLGEDAHTLGAHLKINAHNIINLSANSRFNIYTSDIDFKDFSDWYNLVFETFNNNPNDAGYLGNMDVLINNYSIDIMILTNPEAKIVLEQRYNYHHVKTIESTEIVYYIMEIEIDKE